jgi:flagellar hook-associated protein 1 FlgK
MSSFSGLTSALSSLHAQRRAMEVTGQNIANANTAGYSRQRVDLQAVGGNTVPAVFSTYDGPGSGVSVTDVSRLRDEFLESRGRSEHARSGYLSAQQKVYAGVEDVFAEPSDTALAAQLSDFWAAWHDVSNQPSDLPARSQLVQRGAVVADGLRGAHDALSSQWSNTRVQADAFARDVNGTAATIAKLNETIIRAEAAGTPVNELADERDAHLVKLAELVGITAIKQANGAMDVFVGGSALVSGANARTVEVAGSSDLAGVGADQVRLRWTDTKAQIPVDGQVAAALDTLNAVLPGYADALDGVAAKLASTVNAAHQAGYGLDGGTGRPFYSGTTATTIAVAITDPNQVAASASATGKLDGSNADALGKFASRSDGADAAYRGLVVGLGVAAQTADRRADIQASVTASVDAARSAESGVNLDEEMTNLIGYQRAYEAASRVLTTVDGMLDTLINRTGLVGR